MTAEAKFLAEEDSIIELSFYVTAPAMCFYVPSKSGPNYAAN